jgi:hypothetical protein
VGSTKCWLFSKESANSEDSLLNYLVFRHSSISLDMLLKLVRTFGSMIYSTLSASTSVGVDIEAEQRCAPFVMFAIVFSLHTTKIALRRCLCGSQVGTLQYLLCRA